MARHSNRAEFVGLMAREFPRKKGLAVLLQTLMRLARQHHRLQERACNEDVPEGHDATCERAIIGVCRDIGCEPVFSGDPRGCTVKLKVPSGQANDWGGIGVCVPQ